MVFLFVWLVSDFNFRTIFNFKSNYSIIPEMTICFGCVWIYVHALNKTHYKIIKCWISCIKLPQTTYILLVFVIIKLFFFQCWELIPAETIECFLVLLGIKTVRLKWNSEEWAQFVNMERIWLVVQVRKIIHESVSRIEHIAMGQRWVRGGSEMSQRECMVEETSLCNGIFRGLVSANVRGITCI